MKPSRQHIPALIASALALSACGGGGGISGTGAANGTMRVSITDAPACGYDQVNITIDRVRIHASSTATDADSGWAEVVLSPARRVNLLDLRNGVLQELGTTALPAGKYTQLRLVLAPNGGNTPLANSVVPTGGAETALTTPSGQQTGIKLNANVDVPADKVADVVLDFDACKSVVRRGNSGQYNLKPVIAVVPLLSDAGQRVVGYVDPAVALGSTLVSVQADGVPVKATVPDPDTGRFDLYPVPAGDYDLVVSATGRVTAVMTGVPVTTTAHTLVGSDTVRVLPPLAVSAPRAVTGTVTPATATVRALQTLSGGPQVEVAAAPVDAASGAFAFALPVNSPVRLRYADYLASPTQISFAPDTPVGAAYTIEASLDGAAPKTALIDAAAPVPALLFSLP